MRELCFTYGANTFHISFDINESPYFDKIPTIRNIDLLPYYSTIDDPVCKHIANELNKQLGDCMVKKKAEVVLALIQQSVEYVSDESRFGRDVWELPAYVLDKGVADCDGMTNLYVSIAANMGLDVISVITDRHMSPAVQFRGHGTSYKYKGKNYFHMETTADLPAGGCFERIEPKIEAMSEPAIPTPEFLRTLVDSSDFFERGVRPSYL